VAVRERIAELGVGDAFSLPGHRDDPLLVMSGADLVVLPSVPDERGAGKEACPFALLEAMSVQTAVTAYAAGGIPEVLGDCGRLVAEGDRGELAEAIAALVADEGARTAAADCGLARVRERHALTATVEAMKAIYADTAL
jgi:glycosyltransferase involved in cell wall biosynthesis